MHRECTGGDPGLVRIKSGRSREVSPNLRRIDPEAGGSWSKLISAYEGGSVSQKQEATGEGLADFDNVKDVAWERFSAPLFCSNEAQGLVDWPLWGELTNSTPAAGSSI